MGYGFKSYKTYEQFERELNVYKTYLADTELAHTFSTRAPPGGTS